MLAEWVEVSLQHKANSEKNEKTLWAGV